MINQTKNQVEELILDPELKEQLKTLVLERVNVMPDTLRIAVGSEEFSKTVLIKHIQQEDDIGRQMMEVELEFLRDLASGAVYGNE